MVKPSEILNLDDVPEAWRVRRERTERADGPPLWAYGTEGDRHGPFRYGTGEYGWHSHVRGQLFCIDTGLVHVHTSLGAWVLPPHRAGWIPPGLSHRVTITGVVSGWMVFIAPHAATPMPTAPCVVGVTDLLAALVKRAAEWGDEDTLSPAQERVAAVLLDEIVRSPAEALGMPMPTDARAVRIARAVLAALGEHTPLETLASHAGVSARTARRLFQAETGMNFTQWRAQARLVGSLEQLADGRPVAAVADALGYATPSNFIAMFRRAFGESPGRYFRRGAA